MLMFQLAVQNYLAGPRVGFKHILTHGMHRHAFTHHPWSSSSLIVQAGSTTQQPHDGTPSHGALCMIFRIQFRLFSMLFLFSSDLRFTPHHWYYCQIFTASTRRININHENKLLYTKSVSYILTLIFLFRFMASAVCIRCVCAFTHMFQTHSRYCTAYHQQCFRFPSLPSGTAKQHHLTSIHRVSSHYIDPFIY